jgi:membrane fusion protein (multidrug efflux system)
LLPAAALVGLAAGTYFLMPWANTVMNTVSTDDAYVNGHVTLLAPRISGQVAQVFVDDNDRVKKGDLLVQLDKEPYQVQVAIKTAAVVSAEADLAAANAQVRGQIAQARSDRHKLQHTIENVNTQIANLAAAVATLNRAKATFALADANLNRGEDLAPTGAISKEEVDVRRQTAKVDEATVDEALQQVYAIRSGLGIPAQPADGKSLAEVPPNLGQNFSSVQEDLGTMYQSAAQFGYFPTVSVETPDQALENFYKQYPNDSLDQILPRLIANAPAIKQAEAKLLQAKRDLDQAELNLRYCDIVSEIDGVVTERNVNPGYNVQAGQSLMAVRSVTEIWIDANFKETQLADLRIGQRVRCDVDMYGARRDFQGRITGFTMGTGQTLSLLPPQNATGNYVKIVQRLPVRIELSDYDADKAPLFIGLTVTPYVYYKEPPGGPNAGNFLRPLSAVPAQPGNR